MAGLAESAVEEAALAWLADLGYQVRSGPEIAPGEPLAERSTYGEVVLGQRLKEALARLNPTLPQEALEDAFRKISRLESPVLTTNNRAFHRMLVDGVTVEYRLPGGRIKGDQARLVDFEHPEVNDWLAVNQFTVMEGQYHRRADVVIFINGLPVGVIELKNPADEEATIWAAFNQLQTYKQQIPVLFVYNEILAISDGLEARLGSLTSLRERFHPWRTIEGQDLAPVTICQLEVLLRGVFHQERFLDLIRHFIVFEEDRGTVVKKVAGYHQFHATREAVVSTVKAASPAGDRRAGVVWHTQGSGKSLTMVFFAGKIVLHPAMANPTIVVLTDRNDLDDQLFGVFARCHEIVRQKPVQAKDRAHLRELLQVASGGIVFTTIHKFFPEEKGDQYPCLSERRNIVVIADEAHRSQYDFIDGFARHMRNALPQASFVAFTGTPLELADRNTRSVFGDYISIYDIQRAVEDGATVPIYYESRVAKLDLKQEEKPHLDQEFEEATEGEEVNRKERLKTKWAALEAVVGTEKRLDIIARDLVDHFEKRLEAMSGKAMVVCMSRRICVELYNSLIKLRPEWHSEEDAAGALKVVMTGAAPDPTEWQGHIRNKQRRMALADRFKDPDDPFKVVLVRDMWLTGFDMRKALAVYTESGGQGQAALDQDEAVAVMLARYEICCDLFHGFDYEVYLRATPPERLNILPAAQEHILAQENGKDRFVQAVMDLSKAFALAVPRDEALAIRDEVAFFQVVKAALAKTATTRQRPEEELNHAIAQIVSKAIAPEGIISLFEVAGLKKPDISLLSDEFLAEVRGMPQKNLAVELLRKLLNDEIKTRGRKNVVQARSFAEMLEQTIRRYHNRAIETLQVIEELIRLAKEMNEAARRGEDLGLTEEELAFYDALETNDSAVRVLGDETLKTIARELVGTVRRNVSIDWTVKENVRAKLRIMVKRILRKYGYPPDKQEKATQTVLEQAEVLCKDWGDEGI